MRKGDYGTSDHVYTCSVSWKKTRSFANVINLYSSPTFTHKRCHDGAWTRAVVFAQICMIVDK